MKLGTVHMFEGSTGAVGRFLPQLEAFAHPYVWRDTDHMLKVVRGEIGQELTQKLLQQHGMRILDMGWLFGHRQLTTRGKPVRTPDDMGASRSASSRRRSTSRPSRPWAARRRRSTSTSSTPRSRPASSTARRTRPRSSSRPGSSRCRKYLEPTGHITQQQTVLIGEDTFQALTPDQQKVLQQAAVEAGDYQNKLLDQDEAASLEKLKAGGMQVVEPDIAAFRAATANVHKAFDAKWGEGFFDRLQAVR